MNSTLYTSSLQAVIFDLDGVLVDTARFHDQAWAELALGLGYVLTETDRHALKGRSRADSLEYLLEKAGWNDADPSQKSRWLQAKNARYLELVEALTPQDAAQGALVLLDQLKSQVSKRLWVRLAKTLPRFCKRSVWILALIPWWMEPAPHAPNRIPRFSGWLLRI